MINIYNFNYILTKMEAQQQIEKFQEILENHYQKEIHSVINKGKKSIVLDFKLLAEIEPDLAEDLLDAQINNKIFYFTVQKKVSVYILPGCRPLLLGLGLKIYQKHKK